MTTTPLTPTPTTTAAELYRAAIIPRFIDVPTMTFLMLDGAGDPNTAPAYGDAISALYSLAYGLKFSPERKHDWHWTMMIAQPAAVTPTTFDSVVQQLRHKKRLPALDDVRLEQFAEGRAAQILHRGPYATEGPTIEQLHRFIHEHGGTFDGRHQKHHEIYLSDPNRTAPERLKTILRQPFAAR